jgi:hypothetical protein
MAEKFEEKERFDGQKVKILMPEYVQGTDQDRVQWRTNISMVNVGEAFNPISRYLTTSERYFYSKEGFGSERRKNPA